MSDYYTATGAPANRAPGASATIRNEFAAIQAAFDNKLPVLGIGNASKVAVINSAGTAVIASPTISETATGHVTVLNASASNVEFGDLLVTGNDVTLRLTAYGSTHGSRAGQAWLNASTSATTMVLGVGNAERMRIDSAGNVGIGVTPTTKFEIGGSASGPTLMFSNTGSNSGVRQVFALNYKTAIYAGGALISSYIAAGFDDNADLRFNTGVGLVERMRIDAVGNIGIGRVSIGGKLEVQGAGAYYASGASDVSVAASVAGISAIGIGSNNTVTTNSYGAPSGSVYLGSAAAQPLVVTTSAIERMRIDSAGNVGMGRVSSGNRLEVSGNVAAIVTGAADNCVTANISGIAGIAIGCNNTAGTNPYGAPAGTNYLGNVASQSLVITTAAAERMRIDSAGNVGIGRASGGYKLEVQGGIAAISNPGGDAQMSTNVLGITAVAIGCNNTGSTNSFGAPAGSNYIGSNAGVPLVALWNSQERLRIDGSGAAVTGLVRATAGAILGAEYTYSLDTTAVVANTWVDVIGSGGLAGAIYAVRASWNHNGSGSPFLVVSSVLYAPCITNSSTGTDPVFQGLVSSHTGIGATIVFRTVTTVAGTSRLQAALNFQQGGTLTVTAHRLV